MNWTSSRQAKALIAAAELLTPIAALVSIPVAVTLLASQPADAAVNLSCASGLTYVLSGTSPGDFYAVIDSTGSTSEPSGNFGAGNLDGFGVGSNGATAWAVSGNASATGIATVYEWSASSGSVTTITVSGLTDGEALVAGGVDPQSGTYYFAGYAGSGTASSTLDIYGVTSAGVSLGEVATLATGHDNASSGDLAFNSSGDLFDLASTSTSADLWTVSTSIPDQVEAEPVVLAASLLTSLSSGIYNGVNFDLDGYLYALDASNAEITPIDANTGVSGVPVSLNGTTTSDLTDMGSCFYNGALSISEEVLPADATAAGETETSTFTVTNIGSVTLTSVGVADVQSGGTGIHPSKPVCTGAVMGGATCANGDSTGTLPPSASETFSTDYVVTQADMDAGTSITDSAIANGTSPTSSGVLSTTTTGSFAINQTPSLDITKLASPSSVSKVGQIVNYTFTVTNSGNVTVSDVEVDDAQEFPAGDVLSSGPDCPSESLSLAPGQHIVCTASARVTQSDLDAGRMEDTATANGTLGQSTITSAPNSFIVEARQLPGISIFVTAGVAYYTGTGQPIPYTFLVENSGNVTLRDISILTSLHGLSSVQCPERALEPGGTVLCTARYVTRAKDVKNGDVQLIALATGEPAREQKVTSAPSTVVVPAIKRTVEVTG